MKFHKITNPSLVHIQRFICTKIVSLQRLYDSKRVEKGLKCQEIIECDSSTERVEDYTDLCSVMNDGTHRMHDGAIETTANCWQCLLSW